MSLRDDSIDISHYNRGPRARCSRCGGAGSFYETPIEVQRREVAEGKRKVVSRRMCQCIKEKDDAVSGRT